MRSFFLLILTALIVVGFLTFMVTYTVRFTEAAVVTTFGEADADSVVREPGLKRRLPYPFQNVTIYDTRARLLQARSETQQTADDRQVIVEAFLTWRVSDPLRFYQRFSGAGADARDHYRAAESTLASLLRSALSEVSRYDLRDLFTSDESGSTLGELEQRILARLTAAGASGEDQDVSSYGVEPLLVGVNGVVFPEETTKEVFARMKATRERLAAEAESQGASRASAIRSEADSAARRIESFAMRRAEEIRNRGDIEAAQWFAQLNEDPELAVFLRQTDFVRDLLAKRTTLVLPTSLPGMGLFDPRALNAARQGQLPGLNGPAATGAPTGADAGADADDDAGELP